MNTQTKFTEKFYLGTKDNEKIYLSAPSWDCGWYWGFGYLGNRNCHYHVNGLMKESDLHAGLKKEFGDTLAIRESDIWEFCELMKSFYILKDTAYILEKGGAHYTTNPCESLIINVDESKRINEVVLPGIFDAIHDILERNKDNEDLADKLMAIILDGDTTKVLKFMKKNKLNTDDIKAFVPELDYDVIHSAYWENYHKSKNKETV